MNVSYLANFCVCEKHSSNIAILIVKGTQYRDFTDCRQHGCTSGECIRQGSEYVCKQGMSFLLLAFPLKSHIFLSNQIGKGLYAFQYYFIKYINSPFLLSPNNH